MNILLLIAWDDSLPKRWNVELNLYQSLWLFYFRHLNGTEIIVPTVPDQSQNWFFSFVLYIGGSIHLLMSLAMVITYFLVNGSNFVMPDFFYTL